jgi:hypothetical protein
VTANSNDCPLVPECLLRHILGLSEEAGSIDRQAEHTRAWGRGFSTGRRRLMRFLNGPIDPEILNFAGRYRIGYHCKQTYLSCQAGMAREIVSCSLLNEFHFMRSGLRMS